MSATRLTGTPAGPGEFVVPSRSAPGHLWTVFWQHETAHWCGCARHHHTASCHHVQIVAEAVEIEARESLARHTPESRAAAAARLAHIAQEFDCP